MAYRKTLLLIAAAIALLLFPRTSHATGLTCGTGPNGEQTVTVLNKYTGRLDCITTGTGGGGGTTVYNATATAGFPFGLNVTTLTVTQTVNFNSIGNMNLGSGTNFNVSSGATFNMLANSSATFKGIFLDSTSSAGSSGQVYTSNGAGNSPTWQTISGMTSGASYYVQVQTTSVQSGGFNISTGTLKFLTVTSSATVNGPMSASTYTTTAAGGFKAFNDAGTKFILHRAATGLATNTTYFWSADGTNLQVFSTNGSGVISPKTVGNVHFLDFQISVSASGCTQNVTTSGFCAAGPTSTITTSVGARFVKILICGLLETANTSGSAAYITILRNGTDLSAGAYGGLGFAAVGTSAAGEDRQNETCINFVDKGVAEATGYVYQAGIGNLDGGTSITLGGTPIPTSTTAPAPTTIEVSEIMGN